jgi:hypothetical protein
MDYITNTISSLTLNQFLKFMEDIRLATFILDAWNNNSSTKQPYNDIEFWTICHILQEVKLFLSIWHAVKYTDIGMLKHFINPLIIYFFGAS